MKNFILTTILFISFGSFSQYSEFLIPNESIDSQDLIYEKGDSMIVLVDNSTMPPKVYLLENMTTPYYVAPTNLPSQWSTTILYKQHKTIYHISFTTSYKVVNDPNQYSYIRIH